MKANYKDGNLQPQDFDDEDDYYDYLEKEIKKAVSETKAVFKHKSAEEIKELWKNRWSLENDVVIAELRIPNKINDYAVATLTIKNPYYYLDEDDEDDEDFIEEEHGHQLTVNYGFSEKWINNKRSKNIYSDSTYQNCRFLPAV